jgi:hypothetical protein
MHICITSIHYFIVILGRQDDHQSSHQLMRPLCTRYGQICCRDSHHRLGPELPFDRLFLYVRMNVSMYVRMYVCMFVYMVAGVYTMMHLLTYKTLLS